MSDTRMIPNSEIRKSIDTYLLQDEKSRENSIALLTKNEVTAYIYFLNNDKEKLMRALKVQTRLYVDFPNDLLDCYSKVNISQDKEGRGSSLGKIISLAEKIHEKMQSFEHQLENIHNVLSLLDQRKNILAEIESKKAILRSEIAMGIINKPIAIPSVSSKTSAKSSAKLPSLDEEEEKKESDSGISGKMHDAESRVALEVLSDHDNAMAEYRALQKKLADTELELQNSQSKVDDLKTQGAEKDALLNQTSERTLLLQQNAQLLQNQLAESNEMRQNQLTELNRMQQQMAVLQEENSQLRATLNKKQEAKRVDLHIEKDHLRMLIQSSQPSSSMSLFAVAKPEVDLVVAELKKLTTSSKATFTYGEVEDCIKHNKNYLDMFHNPSIENLSRTLAGQLVRELAFYFMNPPDPRVVLVHKK